MGRLATVASGFSGVSLPSATGVNQALGAGQTVVLTEAEAVSAPVTALVTLGAITLAAANSSPEPTRPQADKLAYPNINEAQFTATTGGTVYLGSNVVTGPAAGVTYVPGYLSVAANNPKIATTTATKNIVFPAYPGSGQVGTKTYSETAIVNNPPTVGAQPGGLSELNVFHVQGAVVSVAPLASQWLGDGTTNRSDSCGTTSGSPTVTDVTITAADAGRSVSGSGIPVGSYVGAVTASTSFALVDAWGNAVNATATASPTLVLGPKTKTLWPAGTVPTFTATVGAVDYFQFVTYDGGLTWFNTLTVKGLA
jgi:hypothetical protein